MIRRPTWILLAVLVVLVGVAVWLQRGQSGSEDSATESTPTPTPARLFPNATGTVTSVSIENQVGEQLEVNRDSGAWVVAKPENSQLTADEIQTAVTMLEGWTVLNALESNPALDSLGLEPPVYTLDVKTSDGAGWSIAVGNPTITSSGYYVRIDDQNPVVVAKTSVDPMLDLLKHAQPTETPPATAPSATLPAVTQTASP
ncbi:MAG TPA: DUF4340 domain-containing protein [Anaerolineaceae bacterium]|jgi:hypothetical protein|nr:DUF4340 domain-containing protein [Anaerolineaceae bacterium]